MKIAPTIVGLIPTALPQQMDIAAPYAPFFSESVQSSGWPTDYTLHLELLFS